MNILWPSALFLLALIPALLLLFIWRQRRRRRFAIRYSSLSLVRTALPNQSRVRRYLPMALFLLALASLAIGLSRPVTVTQVPAGRATVMLALDVSGSMRMDDIFPSRLGAAKQAALDFIDRQKDTNQVGIVAFAGISQLVLAPSTDAQQLERAILTLTTGRGTAIGSGIVTALETILDYNLSGGAQAGSLAEGEYRPDIIVLLTDGVFTTGVHPLEAAQQAKDSGVRVYTISFGTQLGSSTNPIGPGTYFRRRFGIDEEILKTIASITGGEYYTASSASELEEVFEKLPTALITREETLEISVLFAALAALLVIGALLLSQLWQPLP